MGFYGGFMGFNGVLWDFMVVLWDCMVFSCFFFRGIWGYDIG
jgi:hypothetical protein